MQTFGNLGIKINSERNPRPRIRVKVTITRYFYNNMLSTALATFYCVMANWFSKLIDLKNDFKIY